MSGIKVVQEDDPDHKGLWLFGRDVTRVECCRDSILNGCAGATAGSILGYIYKNNFSTAFRAALFSYVVVTLGTWFPCRYSAFKKREMFKKMKQTKVDKVEKSNEYNIPLLIKAGKKDTPDG